MKTYSVVGMNWLKCEQFVAALAIGTPVSLVREPTNEHDANAVAVWVGGQKIGFIPKKQNLALSQFIDQTGVKALIAQDGAMPTEAQAIPAVFFRSENSGYPQVRVSE